MFSFSVEQDGRSRVKPGEQANTEFEEGACWQQRSNQADDEWKVIILRYQPAIIQLN